MVENNCMGSSEHEHENKMREINCISRKGIFKDQL